MVREGPARRSDSLVRGFSCVSGSTCSGTGQENGVVGGNGRVDCV